MKNKFQRLTAILVMACLLAGCFAGCNNGKQPGDTKPGDKPSTEVVDYAAQVKLNMSSETAKQEVTIHQHVDGDTVHFNVPDSLVGTPVLKARFLAVDTPESTGKIEEYGKAASNFTKEKLANASSIIIESDDANWNADSTGGRYLVWIWYRNSDSEEYRNLNIEILQNGLAAAMNSGNNRYGDICMSALQQAKDQKLNKYSGEKDPLFFYGEAVELSLKELRANIADYNGSKVAFEGVVTVNNSNGIYVEEYDAETDMYNGIYVYYGFSLNGDGQNILKVGNRVRIVGNVSLYEASGAYQVSGLKYSSMRPDDPSNIQLISSGHEAAYRELSADTFTNSKVTVEVGDSSKELPYAEMALGTSVSMKNLKVQSVYTTSNEESSSFGAMTLTCEVDGITVSVRTVVFRDASGNLITAAAYEGKTIDVKGIVDCYDGTYQIKVFAPEDITTANP